MMAREGSAVFTNARVRPVAIPRTETRTPTTPAIPMTTTSEGTRRPRRLRRFMAVTAAICFHMLELPDTSVRRECRSHVESRGAPEWRHNAYDRKACSDCEPGPDYRQGNRDR